MKYNASIFVLLLGLLAGPAYALSEPVSSAPPSQQCTSDPAIMEVTITDLLQQPDKYQLHKVCLRGFVIHQFEHHAVYRDQETTRVNKGLWIGDFTADFDGRPGWSDNEKTFLIEGIFDVNETGHMNNWPAGITHITRYEPLKNRASYEKESKLIELEKELLKARATEETQ
ncbi:hypothetical protein CHU32_14455 [Superficieibacter electus]|uniref:Secreted protein n=1 Tax=Superficieibacter electus TaxID=2022662 RepID=A0A2P5GN95_9ENTR|nr:hypothetical protein [Superficieibacter electus]POP43575.1 hypothetical protein CHU33_15165 [Superficieibacter electus]POP48043.1 hypothetical protein CHU32_14455 [Superficieibacter electus]